MSIKFRCEHCKKRIAAPSRKAGLYAECPNCAFPIQIPLTQAAVDKPPKEVATEYPPSKELQEPPPNSQAVEEPTKTQSLVTPNQDWQRSTARDAGNASVLFLFSIVFLCCGCRMLMSLNGGSSKKRTRNQGEYAPNSWSQVRDRVGGNEFTRSEADRLRRQNPGMRGMTDSDVLDRKYGKIQDWEYDR